MKERFLCLLFVASFDICFCQQQAIQPISVGDRVPDVSLRMVNYPSPVAKLSQFRGKYILVDFWATWCYSCIQKFPKLDTLQKKYKPQLQVLLVNDKTTGDDE